MIGTKIEWATDTANAWVGCSKVSPACEHCYAEAMDKRFHAADPHWGKDAPRRMQLEAFVRDIQKIARRGHKTGERPRVFVNSMSDFFEDRRDLDEARLAALDAMRLAPEVDFLLLTKRPEKIMKLLGRAVLEVRDHSFQRWLNDWVSGINCQGIHPPKNLWIGTTCENQEWAEKRIPELLKVPAAIRFLSCEPLLGPVDLDQPRCTWHNRDEVAVNDDGEEFCLECAADSDGVGELSYGHWLDPLNDGIAWVICGGESGAHARPMHPEWAQSLRDQCADAGVPFHFKQWGEWAPGDKDTAPFVVERDGSFHGRFGEGAQAIASRGAALIRQVGKKAAGRLLDGVEHNGMPEPPAKKWGGA